jgi:hypothetical protein
VNRKIFVSIIIVFAGLLVYTSCTKIDTTDLGKGLIPVVDNVHTFDTVLDVITDNFEFNDTTRIDASQLLSVGLIGNDPEFGKTSANLYFSMGPASFGSHPFTRKDSVIIDSVILSLTYSTQYGDSLSMERFDVFQIDPGFNLAADTSYRISEPDFPVLPTPVGGKLVQFHTLNDSVFYVNAKDSIRTINELRIPLDTSFARMFVNFDTAAQYKSDSAFRVAFKGLAIKVNEAASPSKSALAYFNMGGANTRLTFYCRIQNNGKTDTVAPAFGYSLRDANMVRRTPANGYNTFLHNGHNDNDNLIYLASSPGSYAAVKIPGLDNLSNRTIHRAELILEKVPTALDNIYTPPPVLFVTGINTAGDSTFTIRGDFIITGSGLGYDLASLEGLYKTNENRYTFNLSRYVQSIVTKKLRNHTLKVYAPFETRPYFETIIGTTGLLPWPPGAGLMISSPIASGRVVLGGGSHPNQKMRLRIIYSKI